MTAATPAAAHTPAYDVATLTTCDAEPIHVPGAIQPHGLLLSLDRDQRVVMTSANTAEMVGASVEDVLGAPVGDILGADVAALISLRVIEGYDGDPLPVVLARPAAGELSGCEVDLRVHASGERVVVEVEPRSTPSLSAVSYRSARSAMARLGTARTLDDLVRMLAREVRELTDFDRVMVYRFDEHWNGEVVAEEKREDLNPFLGLHYPATDIPAQARRLYMINPIRLIADIGYRPVPLVPILDPDTQRPLDLSHASLRSVSPIHVEYLSNMGVTASMSVSIMVEGEFWGLIACHHYSGPHRPSQEARAASEFVTQVASHLVAHRERTDARDAALGTQAALAAFTSRLAATDGDVIAAMIEDPALLSVFRAGGVALMFDGTLRTAGRVPPVEETHRIAELLDDPATYLTSTGHLAEVDADWVAEAGVAELAAGVLRIGSVPDRWCLWFRPEQRQVVDWGGDPTNKRLYDAEGPEIRLSPRKSFDKWREVMHGRSLPWEPWVLEAAEELGRHVNSLLVLRSREQVAMAESMQRSVVLDRAPSFAGVELVARYRPASTYQLGGDWWDAFDLDEHRLALVVGDVAGHGVAAASAMTQVRTALRAYLYESGSVSSSLDRLDALMDGLLGVGVATALVLVLDRATGQVELSSAGHPDPLLLRPDGTVELLELDRRPLLGVGLGEAPVTRMELPHDAVLVAYTDGLVERRGRDLESQTDRLRELARRRRDESVDDWADRLVAAMDTTDDDTTVLAIRRL